MTSTLHPASATAGAAPRATASATRPPAARGRRTVDAPTRMFHWLFALGFAGAWITAESERWRLVHATLGYIVAGLLVFRLVYGLLGPQPVRLSTLARKLKAFPTWLRGVPRGQALTLTWWRQGQPLAMVVATTLLLALVLPVTLSGYANYNDWGGPVGSELMEEMHEFFGNFFLVGVLAHIGLVLGLSLLRRRNLAQPMLTGRIEGEGPDLVKKNRSWLAALVLLAVLAFGAWQWQTAPAGGAGEAGGTRVERVGHDDD